MIETRPCEAGCARANEIGYGICKRCGKAVKVEVEHPAKRMVREIEESEALIKAAEDSRTTILSRLDSLNLRYCLLVMAYVGQETAMRGITPTTREGRAAGIMLFAEAIELMVPEKDRPWIKPKDKPVEMECEMGTDDEWDVRERFDSVPEE